VLANARALAKHLSVSADDRIAANAPLHSHQGLIALHLALATGAALVLGKPKQATPTLALAFGPGGGGAGGARRAAIWSLPEAQAIAAGATRKALQPLDGVELRDSASGLETRGPATAPGYLDHPSATTKQFAAGGWFRTRTAGTVAGSAVRLSQPAGPGKRARGGSATRASRS
jgi:acyl-CoA synthetase (AMP-forming)/AMP-acid ligase II